MATTIISSIITGSPPLITSPVKTTKMMSFLSFLSSKRPNMDAGATTGMTLRRGAVIRAKPEKISEKIEESVKQAEEVCAGEPTSGECVVAWDEVEELSAAASHARDKEKETDVLEKFCKDNLSDEQCRTYED